MGALHIRLIGLQPVSELRRKADKARRRGIWTVEDIDLAKREAIILSSSIRWA